MCNFFNFRPCGVSLNRSQEIRSSGTELLLGNELILLHVFVEISEFVERESPSQFAIRTSTKNPLTFT